jgi:thiamine-monophosphate kinase
MAARPLGVLVAITLPDLWRSRLNELADGIGDGADSANAPIVGGNMSSGSELALVTTVLGSAFRPLRRDGARVGDEVYVTGSLGGPGAALRSLEAGKGAGDHEGRMKCPRPRIHEAQWLAERGATSAIDVSDGFVADLRHVAAASNVAIAIEGGTVPRVDGVALEDALASAEEYELIVTTSHAFDVDEFRRRFAVPLTRVGRVEGDATRGVTVSGARVANISGHNHFSR